MSDSGNTSNGNLKKVAIAIGVLAVVVAVAGVFMASHNRPPMIATPAQPTAAELAAKAQAAQKARPHTVLKLQDVRGIKSEDGARLMLSGAVVNSADFEVKDPTVRCLLTAPGYTQLATLTATLKQTIPAKATKRFEALNMGALPSETVAGFNCSISSAAAAE